MLNYQRVYPICQTNSFVRPTFVKSFLRFFANHILPMCNIKSHAKPIVPRCGSCFNVDDVAIGQFQVYHTEGNRLPFGNQTWQWKIPYKWRTPWEINYHFHCHVWLSESNTFTDSPTCFFPGTPKWSTCHTRFLPVQVWAMFTGEIPICCQYCHSGWSTLQLFAEDVVFSPISCRFCFFSNFQPKPRCYFPCRPSATHPTF